MSAAEQPWARHFQDVWHSRAGDPRLPYWLRVAALAYGGHTDNGHARFKRGEIALILGQMVEGEIRPYVHVGRAISDAITYGWLEDESFWGCLVVPAHAIKKGAYGRGSQCPIHVRRQKRTDHSVASSGSRNQPQMVDSRPEPITEWRVRSANPSLCSVPNPSQQESA